MRWDAPPPTSGCGETRATTKPKPGNAKKEEAAVYIGGQRRGKGGTDSYNSMVGQGWGGTRNQHNIRKKASWSRIFLETWVMNAVVVIWHCTFADVNSSENSNSSGNERSCCVLLTLFTIDVTLLRTVTDLQCCSEHSLCFLTLFTNWRHSS